MCFFPLQLEISSASLNEKVSRKRSLLLILVLAGLIRLLWAAEKGKAFADACWVYIRNHSSLEQPGMGRV